MQSRIYNDMQILSGTHEKTGVLVMVKQAANPVFSQTSLLYWQIATSALYQKRDLKQHLKLQR